MKNVLVSVYDKLAEEKWDLTQKDFSREYLGKCETYLAYLKSSQNEASTDALVKLWGKLIQEKKRSEQCLPTARTLHHRHTLTDWAELYGMLGREVFEAIEQKMIN